MSFKDTNVLVCGARNYLDGHTLYTTVIPKPTMDDNRIVLTQDMMSKKNTKYIIKWNFVLGEDITVPKNCLIEFDGGSISNDNGENFSLTGQDTYLLFDLPIEDVLSIPLLGTFIYGTDNDKLDNTDGMAKIYLKRNKSFAEQVDVNHGGKSNTIYVIRYDFDLDSAEVTIPADCVLEFDGGSLSNGTIVGNNAGIEAGLIKIFDTDITLSGTWNVSRYCVNWFGAKGNGVTNDKLSIQKAFSSLSDGDTLYIPQGLYIVDNETPLELNADDVTIIWNGTIKGTKKKDLMAVTGERFHVISENGVLQGRGGTDAEGFCVDRTDSSQLVALIRVQGDYSTVEGLKLIDPPAYGIRVESHYCTIDKCTLEGGPVSYNPPGNSDPAGYTMAIDVKANYKHTKILNCTFKENPIHGKAGCWIFVGGTNYIEITNNIFGKVHAHTIYNVCTDSLINNNTIDGSTNVAGVIQHVGANSIISNNIIKSDKSGAIGLFNCENTICDGNIITDSNGGGIGVATYGGATGISFDNIQITNNTIKMTDSAIVGASGILVSPSNNTCKNLIIRNNSIYNAKGSTNLLGAIHVNGHVDVKLAGADICWNKVYNSSVCGIFLIYTEKSRIQNNTLYNVGDYAIWTRFVNDTLISENYVEDTRDTPSTVNLYVDSNGARNHCKNNRCINLTATQPFKVSADSYLEGGNARSNESVYGEFTFTGSSLQVDNANICKDGTINISRIILHPKDQAAAKIQASPNRLYVSYMHGTGYFVVATASGESEPTSGVFWYEVFQ